MSRLQMLLQRAHLICFVPSGSTVSVPNAQDGLTQRTEFASKPTHNARPSITPTDGAHHAMLATTLPTATVLLKFQSSKLVQLAHQVHNSQPTSISIAKLTLVESARLASSDTSLPTAAVSKTSQNARLSIAHDLRER